VVASPGRNNDDLIMCVVCVCVCAVQIRTNPLMMTNSHSILGQTAEYQWFKMVNVTEINK